MLSIFFSKSDGDDERTYTDNVLITARKIVLVFIDLIDLY